MSLPVLILAETIVHRRIRPIVEKSVERRVVPTEELPKFNRAIHSAMLVGDSLVVEIALVVLVYTVGMWVWRHQSAVDVERWFASSQDGQMRLTMAGQWFAFVSVPVFQFILLRWYMRILNWSWFLLRVSHTKLQLLAAHPDRAGGLGFLSRSSLAFAPLLFAQSALLGLETPNAPGRLQFFQHTCSARGGAFSAACLGRGLEEWPTTNTRKR